MKKLLLILLCVPLIGLGQIKVINSSKTTLVGSFSCQYCSDGIKLENKNNILSISYDECDKHACGMFYLNKQKNGLFSVNVNINNDGTVLKDLFNLILSGFNSLGKQKVEKCNPMVVGKQNLVKTIELETIGDNLILNWIGYKEDGQMFFSYKGQQSHALNMEQIKQLFDKE